MPRTRKEPAYSLHRPSGQARVRIDGKDHYLGRYRSPESLHAYDDLKAEWLLRQDVSRVTLTVDDLAILFLEHADAHYCHRDGTPTNGVWTYRPERHKTEHHGRERRIFIGPEGQAMLGPYLERDSEAHCFAPAESEAERNATRKANRRSPLTPSQAARKPRGRVTATRYTKDTYNRAVQRACEAAFGMPVNLSNVDRSVRRLPEGTTDAKRQATKERWNAEAATWRAKYCRSPN